MTPPFEVIVLGVGDTFSAKRTTASLLLRCDGHTLAIDAPDRYRGVLARASVPGDELDLANIDDVLITHVHGDHVNGLEGIAFFKRFAQQRRLGIYTLPEVRTPLWMHRLAAPMGVLWNGSAHVPMGFDDYFDWHGLVVTSPGPISHDLPAGKEPCCEIGPFRVRARRTLHHVPTSALLIEAGGRTLGYSADTAFDMGLIHWLAQADLIIHETNHGPAHTPYEKLARLPEELRGKMRLIHYPDEFDLTASRIVPLREGERLVV